MKAGEAQVATRPAPLLTPQEVADTLGVSVGTIYNWSHERRIKVVKIGRRLRFLPETVEQFIRRGVRKAKA